MKTIIASAIVLASVLASFAVRANMSEAPAKAPAIDTYAETDVPRLDLSGAESLAGPQACGSECHVAAAVAPPVVARVWTCAAPRALQNDATQTVRVCAWEGVAR